MVTLKPVIALSDKRADGTIPVRIRITYKGKVRRLSTNLTCTAADVTRGGKIKNADIMAKANALTDQLRQIVAGIPIFELGARDVDFVVDTIKAAIKGQTFRLDFFAFAEDVLKTKTGPTRQAYESALNAFERFLGKRAIDINDITQNMLVRFIDHVDSSPRMVYSRQLGRVVETDLKQTPGGASTRHVTKLGYIFKDAKRKYNDEDSGRILIPRSPFDRLTLVKADSHGQRNLGIEIMQRIIKADANGVMQRRALDAFVCSFALMGANLADMYAAPYCEGWWVYNRQKTRDRRKKDKAIMKVRIPEQIKPYMQRLQKAGSPWLFAGIHDLGRRGVAECATASINRALRRWCQENNVEPFTFYAARHSWASIARHIGVEKATIDDGLCHVGDHAITDIYADKDWQLLADANQKVLALFDWGNDDSVKNCVSHQ